MGFCGIIGNMKSKKPITILLSVIILAFSLWRSCDAGESILEDLDIAPTTTVSLEIPKSVGNHQIVKHSGYTLSYNEEYEQADWVAYTLDLDELNTQITNRTENFREDPAVSTQSAHLSDYRNSGYDRGHLISAANRTSSIELNDETFLLSNMSPQLHRFNSGLFLDAENAERDAARYFGERGGSQLYIVTGPIFSDDMDTIGECNVAVPKQFYKVFLAFNKEGSAYSIGMILPQEYTDGTLRNYLCTVNAVEAATGLDFFPGLDDNIEEIVEDQCNYKDWGRAFGRY